MKLIFGTTNKRKVEDLQNIINEMNLDIEVISMEDIGWDRGEIDENGSTIEENSLIKAKAILSFFFIICWRAPHEINVFGFFDGELKYLSKYGLNIS